ncbi:MAG: lamin tail domain-containing protein [Ignavibacteriae bacterium]|nr:lamin tail domain-containing protein [Ignavibacteriota bacterium]
MFLSRATLLFLFLGAAVSAQKATTVVISEFATRGAGNCNTACEFVELYNPTSADVNLGGWKLQYRSASGSSYNTVATIAAGTMIRRNSYFLIAPSSWVGPPAADASWTGSGFADNGNIRIVDAANAEIDRVGYGSGNDPKVTPAPNHGEQANNNSVERKAGASSTASSMAAGGAEEFAGNAWNSNNNSADFLVQNGGRNPQNSTSPAEPKTADGSGRSYTTLEFVKVDEIRDVPIVFIPASGQSVVDLRIAIPAGVAWSRTASDVSLGSTMSASIDVVDDTVLFGGLSFSADSGIVTLRSQRMPSITGALTYTVSSRAAGGSFLPVQTQPTIVVLGGPIPISTARENDGTGVPLRLNQFVTVNGIVTCAKELGSPSFLEDVTGGIAVYDFNFSDSVVIGDEVTISGKVTQFNGLTELTEVVIHERVGAGGNPSPLVLRVTDILQDGGGGLEKYEGQLIRLNNVTVNTNSWNVTGSGTNYKLRDASGEMDVRIDKDVNFVNSPAPASSFDIVGVLGQFQAAPPLVGGYQLMPRRGSDIIATGPHFTQLPVERDITTSGMTLDWRTGLAAAAYVRYETAEGVELGTATGSSSRLENSVTLSGLNPGTIYRVQAYSVAAGDTSFAQPQYVVTASATSTGTINVYFNQSVDQTIYPPLPAQGSVDLKNKLLDRIDAAKYSIDLALYSFSGMTGDDVAASLRSAARRGVKVRAIFESDNASSAAVSALRQDVPVILDSYDRVNAGAGLMHNKFIIIDARDRSSDTDDWVITGSWNVTDQGTNADAQNVVEVQDQALAMVYTREFEEMWGSTSDTPNSGVSRFGIRKSDNTPHRVNVRGTMIESFFSPSDRATEYLRSSFAGAAASVYFAILTFTREDLATTLTTIRSAGKTVRGVFDNSSDQGSKYTALKNGGMDVWLKKNLPGLLHHKYALIDVDHTAPGADPVTITGSHNWSNAAEFANNENTLGIHNRDVARQYLQEWAKRYRDAGGTAPIILGVTSAPEGSAAFEITDLYPNPLSNAATISISFRQATASDQILHITDALGRTVAALPLGSREAGSHTVTIATGSLSTGLYFVRLTDNMGATRAIPLVVNR